MATQFKKGEVVRLKVVVPQGAVTRLRMSEDGEVFYEIAWMGVDGSEQSRWFSEGELEAV